jgi:hypothetical protein
VKLCIFELADFEKEKEKKEEEALKNVFTKPMQSSN